MNLKVISGSANRALGSDVAARLHTELTPRLIERFPDGELHVEIQGTVRGSDAFLIQPTSPPVDENFFELFLLADACRRAGAIRITAVVPYFGYARQDRRAHGREPVTMRLVADMVAASSIQRVVLVDFHSRAVEGAFAMPVEHLSAIRVLAEAVRPSVRKETVVVSPDLGAVKMAERYAKLLNLPVAIIHKSRLSGAEVAVERIVGDVRQREILLVDDMITTGATIEKALIALLEAGCSPAGIKIASSHGLFTDGAAKRLEAFPLENIYVSDSVALPEELALPHQVVSIAPLLADAIHRLYENESLAGIVAPE